MMFTAGQIAERVGGRLIGPGAVTLTGVNTVDDAGPGDLTFLGDDRYAAKWSGCGASAALMKKGLTVDTSSCDAENAERALIEVEDADLALVRVLEMLQPKPPEATFDLADVDSLRQKGCVVAASATVASTAEIGPGVHLGPGVTIGPGVDIGERTILHAGCVVMQDSRVGEGCVFWPGVVVRERCTIGDRCTLGANVVIGSEGFGFRPGGERDGVPVLVWLPHVGTVVLGDEVELGAGTCIDRGKMAATSIGNGTKIDNLCQIGHNCRVGRSVIISGCSALAGSVEVGDGAVLGGSVKVADHVKIGAGAKIAGVAALMSDVPAGAMYSGYPGRPHRDSLQREALLRKLPELMEWWRKR